MASLTIHFPILILGTGAELGPHHPPIVYVPSQCLDVLFQQRSKAFIPLPCSLACPLPWPWSTLIPAPSLLWSGFGQSISCHFCPSSTVSSRYSFFIIRPRGFSISVLFFFFNPLICFYWF